MPGFRGGATPLYALKAVCIFPENPVKHGIDAHQGGVLLYDGETGVLTAIVDGAALTSIRTAAVTAVATRALARPDSKDLAVLGAGSQARAHIAALADTLALERVRVMSRTFAHAQALADELSPTHPFSIEAVASVAEAVRGADVVVTVRHLGCGGHEPGALRRAAKYGDGWHAYRSALMRWPRSPVLHPQESRGVRPRSSVDHAVRACAADPAGQSKGVIALFSGTDDDVTEQLQAFANVGVDYFPFSSH